MISSKKFTLALFSLGAIVLSGCSGVPHSASSPGTGGGGSTAFSIPEPSLV